MKTHAFHTRRVSSRRSVHRRAGFTLLEVMMAVGVLTVGAMGLYAMQQAVMRGNIESREMTTAAAIANTWAERIRRDALLWNEAGTGAELSDTVYLQNTPVAADSGWLTPIPSIASESAAFSFIGTDTSSLSDARYCANIRLQWMVPGEAIRADVRVWWPRYAGSTSDTNVADLRLINNCRAGGEAAITTELASGTSRVRAIHLPVIVRWSPLQ